jgi:hypothetical protein
MLAAGVANPEKAERGEVGGKTEPNSDPELNGEGAGAGVGRPRDQLRPAPPVEVAAAGWGCE